MHRLQSLSRQPRFLRRPSVGAASGQGQGSRRPGWLVLPVELQGPQR